MQSVGRATLGEVLAALLTGDEGVAADFRAGLLQFFVGALNLDSAILTSGPRPERRSAISRPQRSPNTLNFTTGIQSHLFGRPRPTTSVRKSSAGGKLFIGRYLRDGQQYVEERWVVEVGLGSNADASQPLRSDSSRIASFYRRQTQVASPPKARRFHDERDLRGSCLFS